MPTTQNVQNVQNVQNIQNVQHTTVPMQTPPAQAQFFHMPAPQTPPAQVQPAQTAVIQNPPPEMPAPMTDWSSEITVPPESGAAQQPSVSPMLRPAMRSELAGSSNTLDLRHHMPDDVIESPTSVAEAYLGSMKSILARNKGNFVVATFLIGTQGTTTWEGLLYEVGGDYLVIHQTGRDRYIVCDMYSLKYIEFYDAERKQLCDNLMWPDGWQNGC